MTATTPSPPPTPRRPQHPPAPSQPGFTASQPATHDASDLGSGAAGRRGGGAHTAVPTTVWMCPDPAGAAAVPPPAVVEYTVRAFSQVGDRVRFALTTAPTAAATDEQDGGELDAVLATIRRLGREPVTAAPPRQGSAPASTHPVSCRLVIAAIPPQDTDPAATVEALPVAGARVVVILTATASDPGGVLIDPSGAIIRAAQARGLRYLQHIVAIGVSAARIVASRTQNTAVDAVTAGEHAGTAGACPRPGGGPYRRVHTDVLVFVAGARP